MAQPVSASLAGPVPAPRPIFWAWPGPRGGFPVDVSVGHVSGFRPPEPSLRCRSCGISRSPRAFAARGLRSGRSFTRPDRHTGQARGITPRRHDVRRLQTAPFPHGEVRGVWGEVGREGIRAMYSAYLTTSFPNAWERSINAPLFFKLNINSLGIPFISIQTTLISISASESFSKVRIVIARRSC